MDPFFVPTFNLLKFTQMHNLIFFKLTPQPKEKSKLFLLLVLQAWYQQFVISCLPIVAL